MNKSKFEELVNLYFDREISDAELECLKEELAAKIDRRREFQSRYQLHRATCSALFSKSATISDPAAAATQTTYQRRYTLSMLSGLGLAACFLVVFTASTFFMHGPANDVSNMVSMETLDSPDVGVQFLESEEPKEPLQGNLTSQLRLAGLTPDIVPSNQTLSSVDTEALRKREAHLQNVIDRVNSYRTYSAIPKAQLIEPSKYSYETSSSSNWSAGFSTSLASFR